MAWWLLSIRAGKEREQNTLFKKKTFDGVSRLASSAKAFGDLVACYSRILS